MDFRFHNPETKNNFKTAIQKLIFIFELHNSKVKNDLKYTIQKSNDFQINTKIKNNFEKSEIIFVIQKMEKNLYGLQEEAYGTAIHSTNSRTENQYHKNIAEPPEAM